MFAEIISRYLPVILQAVLVALFGALARVLKETEKKALDSKEKRDLAKTAVLFVEQVYTDLHGHDKLEAAMDTLSAMLTEKGIAISKSEMNVLLEAAVGEFNEAFKEK